MFRENLKESVWLKIIALVTIQVFVFTSTGFAYSILESVPKVKKDLRVISARQSKAGNEVKNELYYISNLQRNEGIRRILSESQIKKVGKGMSAMEGPITFEKIEKLLKDEKGIFRLDGEKIEDFAKLILVIFTTGTTTVEMAKRKKDIGGMAPQYREDIGKLNDTLLLSDKATKEERFEVMRNLAEIGTPQAIEVLAGVIDIEENKRLNSRYDLLPFETESKDIIEECIKLLGESGSLRAVDNLIKFDTYSCSLYSIDRNIAEMEIFNAFENLIKKAEIRAYLAKRYCETKNRPVNRLIYRIAHPENTGGKVTQSVKKLKDEIFQARNAYSRRPKKGIFTPKTTIFVEGNVTGVGFRDYAEQIPHKLWIDLDVEAENLKDGRVKLTLRGSDKEAQKMIAWMPSASISSFMVKSKGKFNNVLWEMRDENINSWELIQGGFKATIAEAPSEVLQGLYKLKCAIGSMSLDAETKEWVKDRVKDRLIIDAGLNEKLADVLIQAVKSEQDIFTTLWANIAPDTEVKLDKDRVKETRAVIVNHRNLERDPVLALSLMRAKEQLGEKIKFVLAHKKGQEPKTLYAAIKKASKGMIDFENVFEEAVPEEADPIQVVRLVKRTFSGVTRIDIIGTDQWAKNYHDKVPELQNCVIAFCDLGDENSVSRGNLALWFSLFDFVSGEDIDRLLLSKRLGFFGFQSRKVEEGFEIVLKSYRDIVAAE